MADIWRVYDGTEPTRGESWATLSLDEAIALLELKPEHFISDTSRTPRFGPQDRDRSLLGYKHVVVEVFPSESRPPDWRAGFYRSPLPAEDALNRVLHNALAPALGKPNVLRVEHVPAVDSKGRDTVWVTAILAPDAQRRITGDMIIDAVGRLQNVIAAFGIEGTPILQYATEEELQELADNEQ
jgi:hypothetical protein